MITPQKTMLSPAPGFTARVMTRIETYERARARQRALLGALLLVLAALVVVALGALSLAWWVFALAAQADGVTSIVIALAAALDNARIVLDVFWNAGMTVARNVHDAVWIAYALLAVTLTMVWARVAIGAPRFASIQLREEKL